MKNLIAMLLTIFVSTVYTQESTINSEEIIIGSFVEGTLLLPESNDPPLVIMIPGSGPTDRDGNQAMQKNNSLRFLAEGLYEKNIATYRFDKRLTKIMKMGQLDESKIDFDHFIEDAMEVLAHFQNDERFNRITVLGHSQGSLVAMIAAQNGADNYISLAGAGQAIDDVIVDQLAKQAPGLKDNARESFNDMRMKGVAENYSPGLSSIFRPSLQPFLISWMKYEPQEEIAKLDIPILVVNGDKDLQVQVSEAEKLKAAKPDATYKIIPEMNHILKKIEGDDIDNSKSYNEPNRPVMPELIESVADFILG